jgi:hypothetical protein
LFWTTRLGEDNVELDLEEARASLVAHDLDVEDYGNVTNAVADGPSTPATVSFDIEWAGLVNRVTVDASNNGGLGSSGWGGQFAITGATAKWSGKTSGFSFTSDAASTSKVLFAIIGHERNGVFFGRGGGEGGD